jgi:ribosomal protein RSM22 (predicted rRNA methylase)
MLPGAARETLAALLQGRSLREMGERSQAISAQYRSRKGSSGVVLTDDDALAYAAARMPATFAAMGHALEQLLDAAPDLKPVTLLDAGCGPGTAALAAARIFPGLRKLALVDHNQPLLDIARRLLDPAGGREISFTRQDLAGGASLPAADIVTAGYVFAELREADALALADALWAVADQALVITEPGTPDGFQRIRSIRERLLAKSAHLAAPCTHHAPCPMASPGWCRVPVRVQRSRDHRTLKAGTLGYEDEPVAYLALTRAPPSARASHRIVGAARPGKAEIALPACGGGELRDISAPARNRELFKRFKKLDWGDAVEVLIQEPSG